jgi:hypothetical protein
VANDGPHAVLVSLLSGDPTRPIALAAANATARETFRRIECSPVRAPFLEFVEAVR